MSKESPEHDPRAETEHSLSDATNVSVYGVESKTDLREEAAKVAVGAGGECKGAEGPEDLQKSSVDVVRRYSAFHARRDSLQLKEELPERNRKVGGGVSVLGDEERLSLSALTIHACTIIEKLLTIHACTIIEKLMGISPSALTIHACTIIEKLMGISLLSPSPLSLPPR